MLVDLHDTDVVVMVMLIVRCESFLESRYGLLKMFSLVGVLTLNVRVDTRRHCVLTVP